MVVAPNERCKLMDIIGIIVYTTALGIIVYTTALGIVIYVSLSMMLLEYVVVTGG